MCSINVQCSYSSFVFALPVQVRQQGLSLQPGPHNNLSTTFMKLLRPFGECTQRHFKEDAPIFLFFFSSLVFYLKHYKALFMSATFLFGLTNLKQKHNKDPKKRDSNGQQISVLLKTTTSTSRKIETRCTGCGMV